jgi:hypothetical protein
MNPALRTDEWNVKAQVRIPARRGPKLPATLDLEVSMALVLGPMLYAHVFRKDAGASNGDLGRQTAETFCRAFVGRR